MVLTDRARTHVTVAGSTLHELEAQLSERLRAADLEVPRAELATMIRALAGDTAPPLRTFVVIPTPRGAAVHSGRTAHPEHTRVRRVPSRASP